MTFPPSNLADRVQQQLRDPHGLLPDEGPAARPERGDAAEDATWVPGLGTWVRGEHSESGTPAGTWTLWRRRPYAEGVQRVEVDFDGGRRTAWREYRTDRPGDAEGEPGAYAPVQKALTGAVEALSRTARTGSAEARYWAVHLLALTPGRSCAAVTLAAHPPQPCRRGDPRAVRGRRALPAAARRGRRRRRRRS